MGMGREEPGREVAGGEDVATAVQSWDGVTVGIPPEERQGGQAHDRAAFSDEGWRWRTRGRMTRAPACPSPERLHVGS